MDGLGREIVYRWLSFILAKEFPKNSEDLPAITNDFLFHLLLLSLCLSLLFSFMRLHLETERDSEEEDEGRRHTADENILENRPWE